MADHLAVPKQKTSAEPRTEPAVRGLEDARLEGNEGPLRLARHRDLLEGGPRFVQLKARAERLGSRAPDPAPVPRQCRAGGLPPQLKAGVQALSGIAMDDVRVHRNSPEPARLNALAFARGRDIHLASGQEQHLPHEAWHLVQQAQGRVRPTIQAKAGLPVNDDSGLEREADVMGRRSLDIGLREAPTPAPRLRPFLRTAPPASQLVVQRKIYIEGKEATEEAEVQAFFAKHGVHYYYSYRDSLSILMGNGGRRNLDGKGDAVALAQALTVPAEAAQTGIQRKLVEISELFRTKVDGRGPIPEAYDKWYGEMIQNGLCLGFVKVVEAHPDWALGMWQALESWTPPHGVSVDEALEQLNAHIEEHMGFGDDLTGQNFLEAVLLAREAWDHMKEEDDYDDVPSLIDTVTGTETAHSSESIREGEVDEKFAVTAEDLQPARWARIRDYITGHIGPTGTYHIIVWHSMHEMAVRCVLEGGEFKQLIAVETESQGMKTCGSWEQVGAILGPWLMTGGIDEIGVDIRKQEPKD